MKKVDIVIVGGSAAGLTAAITVRRHYPDKSVLVRRLLSVARTQIFRLSVVQPCPVETILEF